MSSAFVEEDFFFGNSVPQVQDVTIASVDERIAAEKKLFADAKARMIQKMQEEAKEKATLGQPISQRSQTVGYGASFARY
eukprot:CFRG6126T1